MKRYHHGDLRRALLDATLRLAGERGAAAVTLREAARLAGVSQTAPYRHFADKTAMLAAASEEGFELLREEVSSISGTPARRIVELAVAYVRFAVTHPNHFRLMFGQGSPPKAVAATLQARARDVFQLVFGAVREWLGGGRAEPRAVTIQIWALSHGMAALTIEEQLGLNPDLAALLTRGAVAALLAGFD